MQGCQDNDLTEKDRLRSHGWLGELGKDYAGHARLKGTLSVGHRYFMSRPSVFASGFSTKTVVIK